MVFPKCVYPGELTSTSDAEQRQQGLAVASII